MLGLFFSSIIAFISTGIDDLFILILHFLTMNEKFKKEDIFNGYFVGIGTVILISLLTSLGFILLPNHYIGFLGLIPIYMGIHTLFHIKALEIPIIETPTNRYTKFLGKYINQNVVKVAAVTLANGGDNIGVYFPTFASAKHYIFIPIILFIVFAVLWVKLGYKLSEIKINSKRLKKYGYMLIPYILIILGIYIILKNGTLTFLFS